MTSEPVVPVVPVVTVAAVTHGHRRGTRTETVLHDVTLEVAAGELVALVGPSGSGKSSLCHLVAGLEEPGRGVVRVGGEPAVRVRDWAAVALLPQRLGLAPQLTAAENAFLPCWVRGEAPPEGLLDRLGLGPLAHRPAGRLSLGEQQRVGVARALAAAPRVAVLDEPTGHQDDASTALLCDALREAARAGCAVLVATHDPALVATATRVVRLHRGRVVDGRPDPGPG